MSNDFPPGALASQQIRQLISRGVITADSEIEQSQIQPASLDLRLGKTAYRVRSSFLPGRDQSVRQCLDQMAMHEIDLSEAAVLEKSCVYIVPLAEHLSLPKQLSAAANPKSSTGRLDVFTRLITDYGEEFEQVPTSYSGPLYAEIAPLTFSVVVRRGSSLSQLRFRQTNAVLSSEQHRELQQQAQLVDRDLVPASIRRGIPLSVDLQSSGPIIGYRAKRHCGVVDVDMRAALAAQDYWEPLTSNSGHLVLDPGEFYILASRESVRVPLDHAAEMIPYDAFVGEFRVHYAGFFDPGFGLPEAGGAGSRAVLEVRSFDVPFRLDHGQNVGRLVYERMSVEPDVVYGREQQSNYQAQGLKLSKHFIGE